VIKAAAPGEVPEETPSRTRADQFPIAGVGTSDGGLAALEQSLGSVPPSSGMAFVIVQHLDPADKGMSIRHGVLHMLDPVAPAACACQSSSFLRSLAHDRQERSIGVILSGKGSSGTLGLGAIKEKAEVADTTARPRELPEKIIAFLKHTDILVARAGPLLGDEAQSALERAAILLRLRRRRLFPA
jgi:two-component system CheB/CheR fusion protein